MKIKNRNIGKDEHPLIIAEIGINHGGCLNTIKKWLIVLKEQELKLLNIKRI